MTCTPEQTYTRHRAITAAAKKYGVFLRFRTILGHYLDKRESVAVIEITKSPTKHPTRGRPRKPVKVEGVKHGTY
jgi:hypothetical protein